MSVVQRRLGYTAYDTLDGLALMDGEQLIIVFPDGDEERVTVEDRVRRGIVGACMDEWSDTTSYGRFPHKGVDVLIRLLGLCARRIPN